MFQYKSNNTDSFSNTAYSPTKLWVDSQITGKFIAPELSFSKQQRFKWSSIYWPQNSERSFAFKQKKKSQINEMAKRISKIIDDQQKNEARIQKIKRSLSMSKSQIGSGRKQSFNVLSTKKAFKLNKLNQIVVNRLAVNEVKLQSTLRDRHGNRCNLYDDPQQLSQRENEKNMRMSQTTGFSTSRKIKLDLPHNYFPGPGTYQIKRYLSQLDSKSQTYVNAVPGSAKTDRSSK